MGKDSTAAAGNGKGTGGVPLMRKDHYKSLGVNKAATDGKRLAVADGNGKRPGGVGGAKGAAGVGAGPGGAKGAGGVASTFSSVDHSTAVKITNEFYYEEENCGAFEDDGETFSSTHRSTIKTAMKVTNEYYHEEETFGLSEDGAKEEGEKDIQDDHELLADEDNDDGAEMGDDGSCGGGYGDYYKDAGVGDDDAGTGDVDDFLNGDAYYYDVAAAGFDYLYGDDDGGDGPDDWW